LNILHVNASDFSGAAARQRAERLWNPARIAAIYAEVYRQAMASSLLL
jgi:hypothetical protein